SGVSMFLKAYGTERLVAEEGHQTIAIEAKP
ncbi:TetR/AcrR family transcriptional regulator, partial [Mesorhizobium sp. M7A.F.Ca.ET.027.03.2.1]